jgi:hypothetical protein
LRTDRGSPAKVRHGLKCLLLDAFERPETEAGVWVWRRVLLAVRGLGRRFHRVDVIDLYDTVDVDKNNESPF